MKFGMNLLLWTSAVGEEHFPLLGQIREWGFDGVELPLFDFDEATVGKVGAECERLGLGRTAVTVCPAEANPISPDPAVREAAVTRLKRAVELSSAAGCEALCGPLHSALGEFSGRGRTEEEWQRGLDALREVAEHAEKHSVTLVIEALNRFECYFLNTIEDAARFCREADHPRLKTMYDSFHANIEEKDLAAAIRAGADQIVHVHISENDRSTPGEGNIDWPTTFAALKDVGYDGWMTIEAFGLALPDLAAATRIWRRMFPSEEHVAKNGLALMKRFAG